MAKKDLELFKEALMNFGASDLNENILKDISLDQLLFWSMQENEPRLSFRSSWALEHLLLKNPQLLKSCYVQFLSNYLKLSNWSSLRSYTKLIIWILSSKNKDIKLSELHLETILEKTFQIVEHTDCPIAVKANGFDILFYLIPYFDWLSIELKLLIELSLEKENTPALKSRGANILRKIG